MSLIIIDKLKDIWGEEKKNNDYSLLDTVKESHGIYIFRNILNNDILYIGEAHEQYLKDRISQNFTKNDSGGTFRTNYMEKESKTFNDFKELLNNSQILSITMDKGILIKALESLLIAVLNQKYNIEK